MATAGRRTHNRQTLKVGINSAGDQLAELASKLTINDLGKGKQKVVPEESKSSSMRAVNTASQSLSGIVQSGWKRSSNSSKPTFQSATSAASSASKHIEILRRLCPDDVDIERAAMSILGKLIVLEMFDLALASLPDMHSRLCQLIGSTPSSAVLISLSLPTITPSNPVILTLVSTYLAYALSLHLRPECLSGKAIETFATSLTSLTTPSLLDWLPHLSRQPTKQLDSLLVRVYTSCSKFCSTLSPTSNPPSNSTKMNKPQKTDNFIVPPAIIFQLRMFGLKCLAHASSGTTAPDIFWDQARRFATTLVRTSTLITKSEDVVAITVLSAYADIVRICENNPGKASFLELGDDKTGFGAFCEHWMGFAKRAGDISALQRIQRHLQGSEPSTTAETPSPRDNDHDPTLPELPKAPTSRNGSCPMMTAGTGIFTTFAQTTILLEGQTTPKDETSGHDLLTLLRHSSKILKSSNDLVVFLKPRDCSDTQSKNDELVRIGGKVDRALEKLRRAALRCIDPNSPSRPILSEDVSLALRCLLVDMVSSLQALLITCRTVADLSTAKDALTRSLDILFITSRAELDSQEPRTFVSAFETISKAVTILDSAPFRDNSSEVEGGAINFANYFRCVSGAFYNLGGTLFQASRIGAAVPFLKESCTLGGKALRLERFVASSDLEGWKQLEDQLFRRWELLGVCYSKNGDRKNAYDAFLQAVLAFSLSELATQVDTQPPDLLFGPASSPPVKQLVTFVDRVSYMGACELLLQPEEVSLLGQLQQSRLQLEPSVIGVLLERQVDSLEPSRWKEGMQGVFLQLLRDLLVVYTNEMPVRRARVLVRCMDFAYRDQGEGWRDFGFGSMEEMVAEIEIISVMKDFGKDASLKPYLPQYRISAHLWMALHAHRRGDPNQNTLMTHSTEEACRLAKELQTRNVRGSPKAVKKHASPQATKRAVPSKTVKVLSPKATRAMKIRGPPPAPKKASARGRAADREPITPKPRTRTVLEPSMFDPTKTTPRTSLAEPATIESVLVFDNFDKFLALLQLTARILGVLGLILPKAQVLDITRKFAQQHRGATDDAYLSASLDLAYEYAVIGKMKRAISIFSQALEIVRTGQASQEISVRFLLRFAESLAILDDVPKSSAVYTEALEISERLENGSQKGASTHHRVQARACSLETAAIASHVFAIIQYSKGDFMAAVDGFLKSLRLFNRSADALSKLNRPVQASESDPFGMSNMKNALVSVESKGTIGQPSPPPPTEKRPPMDGLEWRVSEGLLSTLFSLSHAYLLRGSPREAEYFAQQAAELAEALNVPAMLSRALMKQAEVQILMGHFQDASTSLGKAAEVLGNVSSTDTAVLNRLLADYNERTASEEDPQKLYAETVSMLEQLNTAFSHFESLAFGPRKSLGGPSGSTEVLAPDLVASILRQQLWLLRDDIGDEFNSTLERLVSLSSSNQVKAEEHALMARLTLHSIYGRFRSDMFLSSLAESTIAVPMGMTSKQTMASIVPLPDILHSLDGAEKLLWEHLNLTSGKGSVIRTRDALVSLALVRALQTSLGSPGKCGPTVTASLLDASIALSLRREMLDAITHKLRAANYSDDLEWHRLSANDDALPRSASNRKKLRFTSQSDNEDDDGSSEVFDDEKSCQGFWHAIRHRYQSEVLDASTLSAAQTVDLPSNWTVISVNVTNDKSTLFISRQEGGSSSEPLIFCVPLNDRRDAGGDDPEEALTFDAAMAEFKDIVHLSNETTKSAINIKSNDEEARGNWWTQRRELDVRMRELMDNIEYCWLGAFKSIFNPRPNLSTDVLSEIRMQFEKVFQRSFHVKDKKKRSTTHKKTASQAKTQVPTQVTLDDAMLSCFSTLSPKCRDEELEDLVYFILDLYQFHGVPVAIAEVDVDQVVVDLRGILEECSAKTGNSKRPAKGTLVHEQSSFPTDEHTFLVLDKNVQGLPWESMPILRGRSVSRIPGVSFLHDRLALAKWRKDSSGQTHVPSEGAMVDPRKGYYILNPSGDLSRTEGRFRDWASGMKKAGWDGVTGQSVSEQQFLDGLKGNDLVVYFGHGGGEQYVRSHRIRSLPFCAATMLWGCSSGALRDMGDFDRTGTPYTYMLAGCPTLVANLWDVTDRDIDKFSQSVFDHLGLNGKDVLEPRKTKSSLVAAVAQARDSCKLKYLTGAAPVVYGIPFYL